MALQLLHPASKAMHRMMTAKVITEDVLLYLQHEGHISRILISKEENDRHVRLTSRIMTTKRIIRIMTTKRIIRIMTARREHPPGDNGC